MTGLCSVSSSRIKGIVACQKNKGKVTHAPQCGGNRALHLRRSASAVYPHAQGQGHYGASDKICEVLFEGVLMTDRKDFDVVICGRDWQA
jgi:hypothetical protein